MANYDITMKRYNGSNYDTLYPKNISQQVLLNDANIANALKLTMPNPTILDAISLIQNKSSIYISSYIGTGTYGQSNPTTITGLSFKPKFIMVTGDSSVMVGLYNTNEAVTITSTATIGTSVTTGTTINTIKWNSNGIQWFHTLDSLNQLNRNATVYSYIVLG